MKKMILAPYEWERASKRVHEEDDLRERDFGANVNGVLHLDHICELICELEMSLFPIKGGLFLVSW